MGHNIPKRKWTALEPIEPADYPGQDPPDGCAAVFQNSRYIVFVFYDFKHPDLGRVQRVMIRSKARAFNVSTGHEWADFQRVKTQLFGASSFAIEVYPPAEDLVDVANIYWLWVLHDAPADLARIARQRGG